ncbi:MAG: VanZ family protein [Vulcanibacillus sp.]
MTLKKTLSWTAVILWMILIFILSHQPAMQSNQLSAGLTEVIINTIEKAIPTVEFDIRSFNYIVRKNAHFYAYLIMGILMMNAIKKCGVCGIRSIVITLLICVLYAVSDEFHQLFVIGRDGRLKDVLIDSAGSVVGITMFLFYYSKIKREATQ